MSNNLQGLQSRGPEGEALLDAAEHAGPDLATADQSGLDAGGLVHVFDFGFEGLVEGLGSCL